MRACVTAAEPAHDEIAMGSKQVEPRCTAAAAGCQASPLEEAGR